MTMIERVYAQVVGSASEEAAEKIEKAFALDLLRDEHYRTV